MKERLYKGKFPREVLEGIVFRYLGVPDKDVVLGPSLGEDGAVVRVGDKLLVLASDPITGAIGWGGWLAVNASANDVAVQGARPRWFISCLLLPESSDKSLITKICKQIDDASKALSLSVIGGHAEITPGLTHPIVIGSSMGIAEGSFVTSSGARIGDDIVLTKAVGLEGTAIIASDLRDQLKATFGARFLDEAESFFYRVSVVEEAMMAFEHGATAMHDPTEGGVAGGLHELADASAVGFYVYRKRLNIHPLTSRLCAHLKIDPLGLISSGSLLATAEPRSARKIVGRLRARGIPANTIGKIVPRSEGRLMEFQDGSVNELPRPVSDEIWKVLGNRI